MFLYDGISDIDWFYDGLKTSIEMKQNSKYSILFNKPCVLLDNGEGKVYRFKTLEEMASPYGIFVGKNPKKSFETLVDMMAGKFVDVYDILPYLIERANLEDEYASKFKYAYPNWEPNKNYKKDWVIKYQDDIYRIGQDHTSQSNWIPGTSGTEALYSKIEITESGYEVWKAWDGVSGLYANGQIVKDPTDGRLYQSLIDNNVWGPPSTQPTYWQLYTES